MRSARIAILLAVVSGIRLPAVGQLEVESLRALPRVLKSGQLVAVAEDTRRETTETLSDVSDSSLTASRAYSCRAGRDSLSPGLVSPGVSRAT